jgi:hypothetical protein
VQKPALQILKQSIDNIGNRYASKIKGGSRNLERDLKTDNTSNHEAYGQRNIKMNNLYLCNQ